MYRSGYYYTVTEDARWAAFERRIRHDPAFRSVKIEMSRRHTHWASGEVETEADLTRLHKIAAECGIDRRLDGPFVHSTSLRVRRTPDG